MKNVILLSFALILIMSHVSSNGQTAVKGTQGLKTAKIEAYYFHNTSRCVTCKAVEAEAKADLENLYGGQVVFKAINLEDEANKTIVDKLEISGQTLLIVKGEKKINLTNEGFLYARTNPAKFKSIIKEKVDKL
ncbi:MAG: nitrophenyl compound nitroreductase subunit ArsF family protein [Prolixibacteraceae bacterium]